MNAPENINASNGQDTGAGQSTETPVLLVPECGSSQELLEFCNTLSAALSRAPKELTLRFVGVHQIGPDQALVVHHFLSQKSPKTLLITEAWSSLLNASALVWLLGECRRIRPTAWLFLRKPETHADQSMLLPWDIDPFFCGQPSMDLHDVDYRTVLRLINRYLPVAKLLGSPITAHMLGEFCLLEGQSSQAGEDPLVTASNPVRPDAEPCQCPAVKRFGVV